MSRLKSVILFFLLHFKCFQKLLESFKKKKIGAAYKNSKIFYKIFYADAKIYKLPFFYFNEKLL